MIRTLIIIGSILSLSAAAHADENDLTGTWNISTNVQPPCEFSGQATLVKTDTDPETDYRCELTMRHDCQNRYNHVVRQSCKVRNIRGQVTVTSEILERLSGADQGSYAPDNFRLSVQSENELYGVHHDRFRSPIATWTRATGSIS